MSPADVESSDPWSSSAGLELSNLELWKLRPTWVMLMVMSSANDGGSNTSITESEKPVLKRPTMIPTGTEKGITATSTSGNARSENVDADVKRSITVEEQREIAKELISYFKEQSLRQSVRSER